MSVRLYDNRNTLGFVLGIILITIAAWIGAVFKTFTIPHGQLFKGLFYSALATPTDYHLIIPPVLAFMWGVAVFMVVRIYNVTGMGIADFAQHIRGTRFTSPARLRDMCREWGQKQLSLAGIPVPKMKEYLHFEFVGSTGSGKSQAIEEYIESALVRGDRVICVDPNGSFMSKLYRPNDLVLNAFDSRGQSWSIFNEIRTAYDIQGFAVSLIPRAPSTEQEQWNAMARTIVAETMGVLWRRGEAITDRLHYWLVEASNADLGQLLQNTPAAGMFHGADETLGSVRTVLTRYIAAHKYLEPPGDDEIAFSIRDWLERGSGNLWITWREDMLPALKPLINCWIDVICQSSLSSNVDSATDMHLVIDETDSLDKLNYLVIAATKARKHKLHIACGFQSYAQLDETNGKNDALTLRNSLKNSISLSISNKDTYTAEQIQKAIGDHVVARKRLSLAGGTGDARMTTSYDQVTEPVVLASQVTSLPDLTGYVKLSGETPVARVRMTYRKRPQVTEPLILIDNRWTTDLPSNDVQSTNRLFTKAA